MEEKWLEWIKALQAISQNGLQFSKNSFDIERYEAIRNIAADMVASHTYLDKKSVVEIFKKQDGYATPKVDVRGVVFDNDKILLVKEKEDNRWTLPGGWADVNESPKEAVMREVREESGYETLPVKLLAVYDRSKHGHQPAFLFHVYKLFILCNLTGGVASVSKETTAVAFFSEDMIPDLSIARVTPSQIRRLFEHHRNHDLPTDFD